MTPGRYQQINELADAVLEIPRERRTQFLLEACAGDENLLDAVERLVRAQESDEEFLDRDALERLAYENFTGDNDGDRKLAGQQIGRYEVLSRLGSGGHGEVWLAEDRQLSRLAAVKLLSPEFAKHPDFVRRFYAEARIASALNHPNIVTIYEIGKAAHGDFIAQEFVSGATVRQKLAEGPFQLNLALDICMQISSALGAGHAAGVVHRDIKPENVMVRPDGLVKVLDFGLASFILPAPGGSQPATPSRMIMGTARYMSPEQARGLPVDSRTDLFSLGSVLYEMVAGRPPFSGSTPTETLAAICEREPPALSQSMRQAPKELAHIIQRCLEKDRERRYQRAADLRQDLDRLARRVSDKSAAAKKMGLIAAGSVVLLAGVASVYVLLYRHRATAPLDGMNVSLVSTPGEALDASISPDGKRIAYLVQDANGQSLRVRELGSVPVYARDRQITPLESGTYRNLVFSPDAAYLYYVQDTAFWTGTLYRVPSSGGKIKKILTDVGSRIAFAPGGKRFAFVRLSTQPWDMSIMVANPDGSGARTLATRHWPYYYSRAGLAWSPDGESVIAFGGNEPSFNPHAFNLVKVGVRDGSEQPLHGPDWANIGSLIGSADGRVIIAAAGGYESQNRQLWRISFPTLELHRITNDVSKYASLSLTSDANTFLAIRRETLSDLWLVNTAGKRVAVQISFGDLRELNSAAWLTRKKIVYSALAGTFRNLWMMNASGRDRRQLTSAEEEQLEVTATHDGRYLLYQSGGKIWRVNADGSGPRQLTNGPLDVHPAATPDGKWVIYASFAGWSPGSGGSSTIWKEPIDGGTPVQLTHDDNSTPDVSPDGKLIACSEFIYQDARILTKVAIYGIGGGAALRVFDRPPGTDNQVYWTTDGKALNYFVTVHGVSNIWRQPLEGGPPTPVTAFEMGALFFLRPSPDGSKWIVGRGTDTNSLVLMSNLR